MGVLIFYKCVSCKSKLGTQDAYEAIGSPLVFCKTCGHINVIAKNRTEWELKTNAQKFDMYGKAIIATLFMGIGGAVICYLVGSYLLAYLGGYTQTKLTNLTPIASFSVITLPAAYFYFFNEMKKAIHESKERMKNPSYRAQLQSLGLIKTN